ncbi:putative secreted protein [Alkalihalophilus pseudofirmus OF4]|uniref:Secreted protein n=1 Tax=Alkalihalophilus pseudofirmus (strain ATCC BAA-2126 / JCM 17055 / OF4) TaxID=398511 RepID=D3FY65_ALKPO|nr:putative secreted protein [Alkalihalophilus pseudofirmus OF4]
MNAVWPVSGQNKGEINLKHSWKKLLSLVLVFTLLYPMLLPAAALADAAPGDVIVTLGENLSPADREKILAEMNETEETEIITVSNQEEREYLGDYISSSQIGTRALSSTKITLAEQGAGINVETNNITWVSEGMYANALVTAGVEDAEIYVTAPFPVSGTAALTGLIKAYEIAAEIEIPEEQKQVANEEMVRTAELAESIGVEEATELMNRIKEEIANNPVESEEDLRELIRRIAAELGIELTEQELDGLVSLFMRMKDLNINWDQVQDQISKVRDNLGEFLAREDTQNFISRFLEVIAQLIEALKGLFTSEA